MHSDSETQVVDDQPTGLSALRAREREVRRALHPDLRGARLSLLAAGVAIALANTPSQVGAQTSEAPEEITVTGSRIRSTSGFETPTPVTAVSSEDLRQFDPGSTVSTQLKSLPQFFGNRATQEVSGGTRFSPAANVYSFVNLRNLGGNRTLVLLDGYRLSPSDKRGTVNVDLLPNALMRNVEIVTGGASAAYGGDAVGGVVNFILDREFEGLQVDVSAGQHSSGAGDQRRLGVAGGTSLFDDRFHIIGSIDTLRMDQVYGDSNSVGNFRRVGWVTNPAWFPGAPMGIPQRLTLPDVVSTVSSPLGLILAPGTPLHRRQFTLDGTDIMPFVPGDVVALPGTPGSTSSMSGGPEAARGYDTFNNSPSGSEVHGDAYFAGFKFDATDRLSFTLDLSHGVSRAIGRANRGGFELESPWDVFIAVDNAFLPENVRQLMVDNNLAQLEVSKLGSYVDRPEVGSNTVTDNELTQSQYSAGFEYQLPSRDWTLMGHVQSGKSETLVHGQNVIRNDRLYLAMDAVRDPVTGAIVCRVQTVNPTPEQLRASVEGLVSPVPIDPYLPPGIPGNTKPLESPIGLDNTIRDCVPLNPFGSGNMDPAALSYVTSDKIGRGTVDQTFAEFLVSGDVFTMPAGRASFAAGVTYRDREFIDRADAGVGVGVGGIPVPNIDLGPVLNRPALGIRGLSAGIQQDPALHLFSSHPYVAGTEDIWEWYGELQLPLWRRMSMNTAFRQSDYSRSGVADSWKVGLDAPFTDGWRLRVTRSQDIREPSFQERFDAQGGGANVNDPVFNNTSFQTITLSGGNPDLSPEEAQTTTVGVVWQPAWIDGLQISLDWYDIDINGRIDSLTAQRIVDECFNNEAFCDRITRDPVTNQLVNVNQNFLNLGEAESQGTDLEILWQGAPDLLGGQLEETFDVRLLASQLSKSSTTPFDGVPLDIAGQLGTPEYTHMLALNYGVGPYTFQLQNRYIDSTIRNITWIEGRDVDNNNVASMNWWNLRVGYSSDLEGGAVWGLNFNVQNLFDKEPPVIANFTTRGATQLFNTDYDVFGRRYNLSVNYKF